MILGVSIDRDEPAQMQRFIKKHGLRYPIVLDLQYEAAQKYGVRGTPTTYLIDRAGKMLGGASGPRDWHSEAAQKMIQQLLDSSP